MIIEVKSDRDMQRLGETLAVVIDQTIVIELCGDVGTGKTTLTKGIGRGMGISEEIQSPTFTISRVYRGTKRMLAHYDFYRLQEAGVIKEELQETAGQDDTVTVIEWSQVVESVLPTDRIRITFTPLSECKRSLEIIGTGAHSQSIVDKIA